MSEFIEIVSTKPTIRDKHKMNENIVKATEKQIELLNKLYSSRKITDKMFMSALEDKRFASKIITMGINNKTKFYGFK